MSIRKYLDMCFTKQSLRLTEIQINPARNNTVMGEGQQEVTNKSKIPEESEVLWVSSYRHERWVFNRSGTRLGPGHRG